MATPIKLLPLRAPKAPNLLIAPVQYDQRYQDQLNNALRLYFNQIDNFAQPLTLPMLCVLTTRRWQMVLP